VFDGIRYTLIPELDEIVKHGDPKRRAEASRRIAELFLLGLRASGPITSICSTAF